MSRTYHLTRNLLSVSGAPCHAQSGPSIPNALELARHSEVRSGAWSLQNPEGQQCHVFRFERDDEGAR